MENGDGNVIRVDTVDKAFNSRMTELFQGSYLNEVINKMLSHMRTQIENLALANSRFVFDQFLFQDVNFHLLNLTQGFRARRPSSTLRTWKTRNVSSGPYSRHCSRKYRFTPRTNMESWEVQRQLLFTHKLTSTYHW